MTAHGYESSLGDSNVLKLILVIVVIVSMNIVKFKIYPTGKT